MLFSSTFSFFPLLAHGALFYKTIIPPRTYMAVPRPKLPDPRISGSSSVNYRFHARPRSEVRRVENMFFYLLFFSTFGPWGPLLQDYNPPSYLYGSSTSEVARPADFWLQLSYL